MQKRWKTENLRKSRETRRDSKGYSFWMSKSILFVYPTNISACTTSASLSPTVLVDGPATDEHKACSKYKEGYIKTGETLFTQWKSFQNDVWYKYKW